MSEIGDSVKKVKEPNDWEKILKNYDRWQRRKKQNRFERFKVIAFSRLKEADQGHYFNAPIKDCPYWIHRISERTGRRAWRSQYLNKLYKVGLAPEKIERAISGVLLTIPYANNAH